jgi:hypothetical protein
MLSRLILSTYLLQPLNHLLITTVRSLGSVLKKNDIVLIYNVSNLEKTVFQLRSMG